jgi:hypothetical protein
MVICTLIVITTFKILSSLKCVALTADLNLAKIKIDFICD